MSNDFGEILDDIEKRDDEEAVREIRGAVARGWRSLENAHKEMDSDLAEAITQEIIKLAHTWGRIAR